MRVKWSKIMNQNYINIILDSCKMLANPIAKVLIKMTATTVLAATMVMN